MQEYVIRTYKCFTPWCKTSVVRMNEKDSPRYLRCPECWSESYRVIEEKQYVPITGDAVVNRKYN